MIPSIDPGLAAAVLDAAVRGSLILLAAFGATLAMRRASAASRHLVWMAAITGVLLLPVARRVVPEWRVVPVPAAARAALAPAAPAVAAPAAEAPVVRTPATVAAPASPAAIDWRETLFALWGIGAALVMIRLLSGVVYVHWIESRAVELTDDGWIRLTDGLARRLRLGRIVRLLRGPGASVPMTWGVFRPVILLPGAADEWSEERRRVVLTHELAHVRRWDAATQWLAHLAVAVYWFNPLVWMAARKLREEREHACDDAVLEVGARPVEYADHLLTIVRSLSGRQGTVAALAMARRSQFEGRLLSILDTAVRRNGVTRAAALAALAAVAVCVLPLAALRPVELAAAAAERPGPARPVAEAGVPRATPRPSEARPVRQANTRVAGASRPAPAAPAPRVRLAPDSRALVDAAAAADPRLYAEIIRAAEEIRSDTGRRLVLMELLKREDLSRENLDAIIAATRTMSSDTERRLVVADAVRHRGVQGGPLPPALFQVMTAFTSSTDARLVLETVLDRPRLSQAELVGVFSLVPRIESDTERRLVLSRAAERHRLGAPARDAFVAAARSISSDTDRGLALQSLLQQADPPAGTAAPRGTASTTGP